MKYIQTFLIILFATIITDAHAFQPGNTVIRECPQCKAELQQDTTLSGNTFGAKFWTDGKVFAVMLPDRPRLVKCPKCSTFVWIHDAKKLGEIEIRWLSEEKPENKWPNALSTSTPNEAELIQYAASTELPKDKELYVRRSAWWLANDKIRRNTELPSDLTDEQKANIAKLAALLDIENPDQRIMKAEAYREMRSFEECDTLLQYQFEKAHHTKVAEFIRHLSEQKNCRVEEIKID